jgi:ribosomal protein S27AE
MKTPPLQKALEIVRLKCPNCGKGSVFVKDKSTFTIFPRMHSSCGQCHYRYDREPGYFLGAMYASYALAVFEGIVAFLLAFFLLPGLSTFGLALVPALTILLMAGPNYKLSRVIWMNLFPN